MPTMLSWSVHMVSAAEQPEARTASLLPAAVGCDHTAGGSHAGGPEPDKRVGGERRGGAGEN